MLILCTNVKILREQNFANVEVRISRLMVDLFTGVLAYKHVLHVLFVAARTKYLH